MPEIKPLPGPAHPEQATRAAARPGAAIADNFRRAIAHHQRGQLAQAETLYRETLAQARDHFDALHMLGVIEYQRGRHVAASEIFTQALEPRAIRLKKGVGMPGYVALLRCR